MAGSRRDSIGNILQRLQGLLKSGALKEEDRPIWYDVVKTFQPKPVPPPKPVQKILYPEDFVRAHYSKTFFDKGMINLTDTKSKTVPERFVDTYMEIHRQKLVPSSEIFDKTVSTLKDQGYRLLTHEEAAEIEKTRGERLRPRKDTEKLLRKEEVTVNVDDLFSDER